MQTTVDDLMAGLIVSGSAGTLNTATVNTVIEGTMLASATASGS